jgi:rRNA maturation endonuclease Nob1
MKENMETNTKNISKLLKSLNVCRQELNLPPYKQCSNCSHIIKNETTECPNCGYKLK